MPNPQRFLANNANLIRDAVLIASDVLPVDNVVLALPQARAGNGQASLTGPYTGDEPATFDVQVVDVNVADNNVSTPIFTGAGSGRLDNIVAGGAAQTYSIQMRKAGTPAEYARAELEGVTIRAAVIGEPGNLLRVTVDQSGLTFAPTAYSTLQDIKSGAGAPGGGLVGPGFDWDAAALNPDGTIPASAHRIAFGNDRNAIYVQYKQFVGGEYRYFLSPPAARDIPKGTPVYFVTGGRDVVVTNGTATETYVDIVTVFDCLDALRGSGLLVVVGVVANDRTPGGQGARDLAVRTDAHAELSTGSGSRYATGFVDVTIEPTAQTELVTAICYAVKPSDHALANVGAERWTLQGTLSGDLGTIVTGERFTQADRFALTIPVKLPPAYDPTKGKFQLVNINYASRADGAEPPPICPVALSLGPAAVDETITLRYVARPSGACNCDAMPIPRLDPACLGADTAEGSTMGYSTEARTRLIDLRLWFADIVRANSNHGDLGGDYDQAPMISRPITRHGAVGLGAKMQPRFQDTFGAASTYTQNVSSEKTDSTAKNSTLDAAASTGPIAEGPGAALFNGYGFVGTFGTNNYYVYTPFETEPLKDMVDRFERTIADIDALPDGAEKDDGLDAWDTAVTQLQDDVEAQLSPSPVTYSLFGNDITDPETGIVVTTAEALTAGDVVLVYRKPGTDNDLLARKWVPGIAGGLGFVSDDSAGTPDVATVKFAGIIANVSGGGFMTPGALYFADNATPGAVTNDTSAGGTFEPVGQAINTTDVNLLVANANLTTSTGTANRMAILADRYRTRLAWVLTTAGISPLGKSSANTEQATDGCWRDWGGSSYWTVAGSVTGGYAPLFANHPYIASRSFPDGAIRSTHEFGLQLNVKCENDLRHGDEVVLSISNAQWGATYQVGDELSLPIVAAAPLALHGGDDGDAISEWYVAGSVAGALPNFEFDADAPAPYAGSIDLSFEIVPGGVPFAVGDRFQFAVEGGHFQYRKNGGAWQGGTPGLAITATPQLLADGLSVGFTTGARASFVVGDLFRYRVLQPWALSNLTTPTLAAWRWSGSSAMVDIDFGSVQQVDMVALLHALPEGATVTLTGGDVVTPTWSETLTWRAGVIWQAIDRTARYVRLTIDNATDGRINWAWLGVPVTTLRTAEVNLRRVYAIQRAAGMLQSGLFVGKTVSGDVEWTEGALTESDVAALSDMLDYIKQNDDEPILFIPQVTRANEPALFAKVGADDLDFPDVHGYQPNASNPREMSARIPLAGIWR
jgi:hypothetical protein